MNTDQNVTIYKRITGQIGQQGVTGEHKKYTKENSRYIKNR